MSTQQYLLVIMQRGRGCGYTIGCGTKVETIDARNRDSALKKVKQRLEARNMLHTGSKSEIANCLLLALPKDMSETHVPYWVWIQERIDAENTARDAADLAEYKRLRKKYDDGG